MWNPLVSLVLVAALAWTSVVRSQDGPLLGTSYLTDYRERDGFKEFLGSSDFFIGGLSFTAVEGAIVAGAADKVYLLDMNLKPIGQPYVWTSNTSTPCVDAKVRVNQPRCQNYIRLIRPLPTHQNHLFVCGTNSGEPLCRILELSADVLTDGFKGVRESTSAAAIEGILSPDPTLPALGEFLDDATFFGANFYGSEAEQQMKYSISFSSVTYNASSEDLSQTRRLRTLSTENLWLRFPVNFVDYYRADYEATTPATDPQDYQFYFVFLTENLHDPDNAIDVIVSRVVRICRNDPGSNSSDGTDGRYFKSYLKARVFCQRRVPTVPSVPTPVLGAIDYQYDVMRSMAFSDKGRYHESGDSIKIMYGAFTGPHVAPSGSALCVYRADNSLNRPGGDGQNGGVFDIFRESVVQETFDSSTNKVTRMEVENSWTECSAAGARADSTASSTVLMARNVEQISNDALILLGEAEISQIVVEKVCVVSSSDPRRCVLQDVLFLGTGSGKILKVAFATSVMSFFGVISEEISVGSDRIAMMKIQEVSGERQLFISTDKALYRIPVQDCGRHVSRRNCLGSRDPYCFWDSSCSLCVYKNYTEGDTIGTNMLQNIHTGDIDCGQYEIFFPPTPLKVVETEQFVTLSIVSTTEGAGSCVQVLFSDGLAKAGDDYDGTPQDVMFNLERPLTTSVNVSILANSPTNGDRTFTARLSNISGTFINDKDLTVVITITKNESTPLSKGGFTTCPNSVSTGSFTAAVTILLVAVIAEGVALIVAILLLLYKYLVQHNTKQMNLSNSNPLSDGVVQIASKSNSNSVPIALHEPPGTNQYNAPHEPPGTNQANGNR